MNRTSLKYLVVGLLVGGLVTGGIDASALVPSGSDGSATSAGAAAVAAGAKKKPAKKKKATAKKKKATKKKKAKKKKPAPAVTTTAPSPMIGLFRFKPGAYANSKVSGSYIRLVLAGGTRENGPFFPNPSSRATTYTLLNPGTDGGLRTGGYQPAPTPAFNATGDALANRIIAPQRFAFIQYSAQTSPIDPQTGATCRRRRSACRPTASSAASCRPSRRSGTSRTSTSGRRSRTARSPGLTSPVSGTYNAETKAFTLEWTSQIVGGAFNNFSAAWHFEGTFEPGCA